MTGFGEDSHRQRMENYTSSIIGQFKVEDMRQVLRRDAFQIEGPQAEEGILSMLMENVVIYSSPKEALNISLLEVEDAYMKLRKFSKEECQDGGRVGGLATVESHGDQLRNGGRATVESHGDQLGNGGRAGAGVSAGGKTGVTYVTIKEFKCKHCSTLLPVGSLCQKPVEKAKHQDDRKFICRGCRKTVTGLIRKDDYKTILPSK